LIDAVLEWLVKEAKRGRGRVRSEEDKDYLNQQTDA
jgi:hypothetical protein